MVKIERFSFGSMVVDGKKFVRDLTVDWTGLIEEREGSHNFSKYDMEDILLREPEIVVIGSGTAGNVKIDERVLKLAKDEKIELIIAKTESAIKQFNSLVGKKVVAVMHLTC